MQKYRKYQIAIWILSIIIVLQGIFIIALIRPKKAVIIPVAIKGKVAIVLDDWGYNLNNLYLLEQIKYPLTMSVLPSLNYSRPIAEELHKRGFEIILHLPMEPHEKYRLEQNTILTSMDEATIKEILDRDLANLPYVKGVSNHMGSKATEDIKTMRIIFNELKRRHLYFLDSLVSPESVGFDLANERRVAFSKRDVFLDNEEKPEYIKGQISKLKTRAMVYGRAIGIGHDRKVTLEVLKEVMPQMAKEGYRFVFVSDLVK